MQVFKGREALAEEDAGTSAKPLPIPARPTPEMVKAMRFAMYHLGHGAVTVSEDVVNRSPTKQLTTVRMMKVVLLYHDWRTTG